MTIDGETIPFRMLRPAAANEPDRDRRRRIEEARFRLQDEHLNPVHLEAARIEHAAVAELGAPSYAELYRRFGFRLDDLAGQCRELLDSTEQLYETSIDRVFRARLGLGLDDARAVGSPPPLPRAGVGPAVPGRPDGAGARGDARRPRHRPALAEEHPPRRGDRGRTRSPRAFCAPIEVPGRVMLVIQPIGGARRLAGALPRGRPRGALRATPRRPALRGAAARRHRGHRGLGDAAAAPRRRPRLAQPAPRLPAAARVRRRGRDQPPLLRAALRGEAPVRARAPRRPADPTAMRAALRRAARGRAQGHRSRTRTT